MPPSAQSAHPVYKGIDSRLILDDLYAKLALFAQYMAQKGE